MSWSLSVPKTIKSDFDAAVDDAKASGQPDNTPGLAEDVAAAKDALKSLAKRVKRSNVGGSASGHCLAPGEGANYSDSISVQLYGSE